MTVTTIAQEVSIYIKGTPGPQGSKVQTRWGGLRESSAKVGPWRALVNWHTEQEWPHPPIADPVRAEITFFMPRAKNHFSTAKGKEHLLVPSAPVHCTVGGDIDKLVRATLDGLAVRSGGSLIRDDSQVIELVCRKLYADEEHPPGALVILRRA